MFHILVKRQVYCGKYKFLYTRYYSEEAVVRRCYVKKGVLRTGKHLCQSLFFNKVNNLIKNLS